MAGSRSPAHVTSLAARPRIGHNASMPDASFKDFILDQLRGLDGVRSRAMFGGYGLYCGVVFFGILYAGRCYLKTDERSRAAFTSAGMHAFQPSATQTLGTYFEVPADVLEDAEEFTHWAQRAVACGKAGRRTRSRKRRSG